MTIERRLRWLIAIPVTLLVLAVGGTWVYINLIKEDPPDRLTLDASSTGEPSSSTGIEGTWKVTTGSEAGYRATEVLFGQKTEGVGRTTKVTGQFVLAGTSVTSGSFTVDMASVASDESRRDNQYRGRIMDVAQFPTSTFVLTSPIELGSSNQAVRAKATGDLTLRGQTKRVTIDVDAQLRGGQVQVVGSHPIVWSEWGIPSPSFGPAEVEDDGLLEFKLVFAK